MKILTAEQMKNVDRRATDREGSKIRCNSGATGALDDRRRADLEFQMAGRFTDDPFGTPMHIHEQSEFGTTLDGVVWDQYPD